MVIDNHLRQASATTGVSYFLTDPLGSTVGLTDVSGNVLEQVALTRSTIAQAALARAIANEILIRV